MNEKCRKFIDSLKLIKHPEGGYYRETYRSPHTTVTERGGRNLCTIIYYLLPAGEKSAKHRVKSDELWIHMDGNPVNLTLFKNGGKEILRLGKVPESDMKPQILIPAQTWFSAEVWGTDYALVSCVVCPGFTFDDFELAP